jgi:predicted dehydrogenase
VADRHNIAHIYDSYDAVLQDDAVDAVYIPLPNHLHCPWTLAAIKAGKHVLCEKPLACTRSEARAMADAAAAAGMLLMEACMHLFHPRTRAVRERIDQGEIGALRMVRTAFCSSMNAQILRDGSAARLRPECGGGALLDVGCYAVNIARWLFHEEPLWVQAQAVYHVTGVDLQAAGTLKFPGGGLATLEVSFMSALQQTYTAVGAAGAIELPHNAFIPWEHDTVYTVRKRDDENGRQYQVKGADEYQLMVEHFADAVISGTPLQYAPAESIGNMLVLDALAQAARTGTTQCLRPDMTLAT